MTKGQQLATEAILAVGAAHEEWVEQALILIKTAAKKRATFSSDLIWLWLDRDGIPPPKEPRAMGAAFSRAQKLGVCVPTQKTIESIRDECHARPIRIWESRIYK